MAEREDRSCGIVPLQRQNGQWRILMILQSRTWSFPKGHPIQGETTVQTAERELKEETGLHVIEYLSSPPLDEVYTFTSQEGEKVRKTVEYLPALVAGTLSLQAEEICDARWTAFQDAEKWLSYPSTMRIWTRVRALLETLDESTRGEFA